MICLLYLDVRDQQRTYESHAPVVNMAIISVILNAEDQGNEWG